MFFQDTATAIADAIRSIPGLAPHVEKARQADLDAEHQERIRKAAEARRIEAADLAALHTHDRETAPLRARISAMERELLEAKAALEARDQARRLAAFTASTDMGRLRAWIEACAPREDLDGFEVEMRQLLDNNAKLADSVTERCIDGLDRQQWTNAESLRRRADAIVAAQKDARALAAEVLEPAALLARLEDLRRSIPQAEARPAQWML